MGHGKGSLLDAFVSVEFDCADARVKLLLSQRVTMQVWETRTSLVPLLLKGVRN